MSPFTLKWTVSNLLAQICCSHVQVLQTSIATFDVGASLPAAYVAYGSSNININYDFLKLYTPGGDWTDTVWNDGLGQNFGAYVSVGVRNTGYVVVRRQPGHVLRPKRRIP